MNVLNDLVKIVNQIRGKENLFGYQSTTANQFHLTFCFMGEIYRSPVFHKHTKLVWFVWQLCGLIVAVSQMVLCLIYRDKKDAAALLYSMFAFMYVLYTHIVMPYISVIRHSSNLHDVIRIADRIITKRKVRTHEPSKKMNLGKLLVLIFLFNLVTLSFYIVLSSLSVILFYEEEKVKNYIYYDVFIPKLDKYGSLSFFLISNNVINLIAISVLVCTPMAPFIFVFLSVIFRNEMQQIINDLNSLSANTDMTIETYKNVEPKFKHILTKCTRDFQVVCKMFECFRGFYEDMAAIILPTVLYVGVTHAFLFVSPGTSTTVRLREITVFFATVQLVYMLCWTGEMVTESAQAVSFAVYSTPWYWSTSFRKDVYILLCQTQRPITVVALGTYPLSLATFLRFMNIIQSSVNVLRQITS
ncbi:uncharacterized protein LOC135833228 [Planococcus citri]|uniref:uncharacterized protein LOC135833228 n=1 Tax=Planococcus citri TaxID=170843 RepID=UPI0031F8FE50